MSTVKTLMIALVISLALPAVTYSDVNCSDVKSKNRDECVRAKRNNNDRDNNGRGSNIDCSNARDKNKDECARAKWDNRKDNIDKDDVECRNAKDPDVRRECLKRKY